MTPRWFPVYYAVVYDLAKCVSAPQLAVYLALAARANNGRRSCAVRRGELEQELHLCQTVIREALTALDRIGAVVRLEHPGKMSTFSLVQPEKWQLSTRASTRPSTRASTRPTPERQDARVYTKVLTQEPTLTPLGSPQTPPPSITARAETLWADLLAGCGDLRDWPGWAWAGLISIGGLRAVGEKQRRDPQHLPLLRRDFLAACRHHRAAGAGDAPRPIPAPEAEAESEPPRQKAAKRDAAADRRLAFETEVPEHHRAEYLRLAGGDVAKALLRWRADLEFQAFKSTGGN